MQASHATVSWSDPNRRQAFERWLLGLQAGHGLQVDSLASASADASFRRYLRLASSVHGSCIVMDAPPPMEDVRPFVQVAALLQAAELCGPRVLAANEAEGFLLLTDLGSQPYLAALQAAQRESAFSQADALMRDALSALVQWQLAVPAQALPPFDDALLQRELDLFPTWCIQAEHGLDWTTAQHATWQRLCALLKASALAQPLVAVHADWMPRNLMLAPQGQRNPAILDFQDAVAGPIAYDVASLLRDAFIEWEEAQELDWAVRYWQQARAAGLPVDADFGEFWRALEWMGLQRHLKVMGIFCRLKHRDGKSAYSQDLPRFVRYARKAAMRYAPLKGLLPLLEPLPGGVHVEAGFTF